MPERFKTLLLAGLILLSLYLTYTLWFGGRYLEEVALPRYEFVFFTPVPTPGALLTPAEIVLRQQDKESLHLLRRGETDHMRLWQAISMLLQDKLPDAVLERTDEAELALLLQEAPQLLLFRFAPPLPLNFLTDDPSAAAEFQEMHLFARGDVFYLLLEGSEKSLYRWLDPGEKTLETLIANTVDAAGTAAERLPPLFLLSQLQPAESGSELKIVIPEVESDAESQNLEDLNGAERTETNTAAAGERAEAGGGVPPDSWKITVPGSIYVPLTVAAGEIPLTMETIAENELSRAFFLDPTMARRIKERDGAIYFTDGKRGLRIYAGGALEYTAPGQKVTNNRLSYGAALLQAAENLSLYGGWPYNAFLERREKTAGGYHFSWRSILGGLPLITEEGECAEMLVNDKGMPFYRRSFFIADMGRSAGPLLPYRHYKEVLWEALKLQLESFRRNEATLLAMEPVYLVLPDEAGVKAMPAWAVHFAETGRIYLHWQTLELL